MISLIFTILVFLFFIAVFVYGWSILVRRWHDLGHSGWFSLLSLIPIVNIIVLICLWFIKGDEGANAYGEPNVGKPFWRSVFAPGSLHSTPAVAPIAPAAPAPVAAAPAAPITPPPPVSTPPSPPSPPPAAM